MGGRKERWMVWVKKRVKEKKAWSLEIGWMEMVERMYVWMDG